MELSSMLNCEPEVNNGISDRLLALDCFFYGGPRAL